MTYAQSGLIEVTDYNNFLNGANQLNTVWATGSGNAGYGQTALTTKSVGNNITATEWASLINSLNSILTHQSGTGSGIAAVTTGAKIDHIATLASGINTSYTNRLTFNSQGSTTTQSPVTTSTLNVSGAAAQTLTITRTATFASGDAARYFFNSGGQLNLVLAAGTNTGGTGRGAGLLTMSAAAGGVTAFRAATNGGRTGTGQTQNTNNTAIGYFGLTTSNQNIVSLTAISSPYTAYPSDTIVIAARSNGVQGANADVGTVITFTITLVSAAQATLDGGYNDSINISIPNRIDVVYPESTNLTASWGTVTIG
jgi:hypothetical protein